MIEIHQIKQTNNQDASQSEEEEETTRCDPPIPPASLSSSLYGVFPLSPASSHCMPCVNRPSSPQITNLEPNQHTSPSVSCSEENISNDESRGKQIGEKVRKSRSTLGRKKYSKTAFGRSNRGLEPTPLDPTSPLGPPTVGGELGRSEAQKRSYTPGDSTPGAHPPR